MGSDEAALVVVRRWLLVHARQHRSVLVRVGWMMITANDASGHVDQGWVKKDFIEKNKIFTRQEEPRMRANQGGVKSTFFGMSVLAERFGIAYRRRLFLMAVWSD